MPQHNKTVQQMQDEIVKLNKALGISGLPIEEANIYRSAIAEIERNIEAAQSIQSPQRQPVQKTIQRTASHTENAGTAIPTRIIKAGEPLRIPQKQSEKMPQIVSISAMLPNGQQQVKIDWGNGVFDTLTEGDARSRFTTALRDLSQSRMARQDRFDDIRRYITYGRAEAYYRALMIFWGSAPTPSQLEIYPLSKIRQRIFDMIHTSTTSAIT